MAENVVLPLEKVANAIEGGFPTDEIFCTMKDFDDFSPKLVSLSLAELERQRKLRISGTRFYSREVYEKVLELDKELKLKVPQVERRAKTLRDVLYAVALRRIQEKGGRLVEPPSWNTIKHWITGKYTYTQYAGITYLESYLKKELGILGAIRKSVADKRWPLNVLLFLGYEICKISLFKLGSEIESMSMRGSDKPVKILKALFSKDYALDIDSISLLTGMDAKTVKSIVNFLERHGYIVRDKVQIIDSRFVKNRVMANVRTRDYMRAYMIRGIPA